MAFWEGTQAEQTALKAIALLYTQGDLLTNQNLQSQLLTLNASWVSPFNISEHQIDGSGAVSVTRNAKINIIILSPDGGAATGTLQSITEANTFSNGDVIYIMGKESRIITVTLDTVSVKLREAGHFLKLVRVYGRWMPESMSPDIQLPFFGYIDEWTALASDTEITVTHQILKVLAVSAPTPAEAEYAVDTASGSDGTISLYVDGILITTFTYTAASTPVAVINGLSANMATYTTAFINTTDTVSVPPTITIIEDRNLGAAGNAFLLSDQQLDGATGTINSNFAGGANGAASNVTIDTIQGLVVGNSYQIHNGMGANTVTLDTGGNLLGSVLPLTLAVGDWAWVSCVDAGIGRVK